MSVQHDSAVFHSPQESLQDVPRLLQPHRALGKVHACPLDLIKNHADTHGTSGVVQRMHGAAEPQHTSCCKRLMSVAASEADRVSSSTLPTRPPCRSSVIRGVTCAPHKQGGSPVRRQLVRWLHALYS